MSEYLERLKKEYIANRLSIAESKYLPTVRENEVSIFALAISLGIPVGVVLGVVFELAQPSIMKPTTRYLLAGALATAIAIFPSYYIGRHISYDRFMNTVPNLLPFKSRKTRMLGSALLGLTSGAAIGFFSYTTGYNYLNSRLNPSYPTI